MQTLSETKHYLVNSQLTNTLICQTNELSDGLYDWDDEGRISSGIEDSGINLKFVQDYTIPAHALGFKINFNVACEPVSARSQFTSDDGQVETRYFTAHHGYWLIPRSSIGKTPLRQSNHVGLIDEGYRGHIMVKVDNLSDQEFTVKKGDSLFQLVLPNLFSDWTLQKVDQLNSTERGSGCFGSTGK